MLRNIFICAVVVGSAVGCTTAQQRPEGQASLAASGPCSMQTGSRLGTQPGHCSASPGRTYSQQDLERTGEVNVGDALQLLDTSITVHH
jgi:hypothetical protein